MEADEGNLTDESQTPDSRVSQRQPETATNNTQTNLITQPFLASAFTGRGLGI